MGEPQNAGSQKTTKSTGERSHDDVEGQAEGQFASSVPSRKVICDSRHHARFEHAEKEPHARSAVDVGHECGTDRADTKAKREKGNVPPWAEPFAGHVGRDFEEDIRDIEDGENFVVVIASQAKIGLETSQLCVTYDESVVVRPGSLVLH
jgi:hypothetical protein